MSVSTPAQLARAMKGKKGILILTGSLCDQMELGEKKLSDYAADLALKLDAPIAASANTVNALRAKGTRVEKKLAIEIVEMLRYDGWRDPIMRNRPEVLIFIGYPRGIASGLVSATEGAETIVLGTTAIAESTYSSPDQSQSDFEQSLKSLLKALGT